MGKWRVGFAVRLVCRPFQADADSLGPAGPSDARRESPKSKKRDENNLVEMTLSGSALSRALHSLARPIDSIRVGQLLFGSLLSFN